MAVEPLVAEYNDTAANMRQYGTLRYVQLTLFAAFMAGLGTLIFQVRPPYAWSLKLLALVVTVTFWCIEESSTANWKHYIERAKSIEQFLGMWQYSLRPQRGALSATNAVRLLFATFTAFWLFRLDLDALALARQVVEWLWKAT